MGTDEAPNATNASQSELGLAPAPADGVEAPSSPTAFGGAGATGEEGVADGDATAADYNPERSLASALETSDQLGPFYKYFGCVAPGRLTSPLPLTAAPAHLSSSFSAGAAANRRCHLPHARILMSPRVPWQVHARR